MLDQKEKTIQYSAPHPWGIHSMTPSGYLKVYIVLNPIFYVFFLYMNTYD